MRQPRCRVCGVEIVFELSEVSPAADWICLECSGATLADFMEEGMTEEDYSDNQIETMRTFHGKD